MVYETLLIGLLAAVLYTELTETYPGGIIVPAYVALYLDQPLKVLATVAVAFLSLATFRLLSRFLIIFGKRRFVLFVLVGAVWAQGWGLAYPQFFAPSIEMQAVGWIIPGLLANTLERQRVLPTLASMLTVAVLTYFLVRVIGYAF